MEYDVIIIGMGISGISAAIYAKNSGLNVLMLESNMPGGLINKINTINNYPGYKSITGPELSYELFASITNLKIPYKITTVTNIIVEANTKKVVTNDAVYNTKNIIIATGRKNRKLGLENEEKLLGHGISTCALCDGNLYKGKEIAVVGGGNSAIEEAIYLSKLASKVYVIHRRNEFRAEESLINELKNMSNIEFIMNSKVTSLLEEDNHLNGIIINNTKKLMVAALFVYIGFEPNNEFIGDLNILDETGYIKVNQNFETPVPNIYAVGDCIKKEVYQLVTNASDGVLAAIHIIKQNKQ